MVPYTWSTQDIFHTCPPGWGWEWRWRQRLHHLTSALMTTSTKWDFSPLQSFSCRSFHSPNVFSPPEERLQACLGKKNDENVTKWIVFVPVKSTDISKKKKKNGRRLGKRCSDYLEMCFFFSLAIQIVRGGMRDNSNSTAKFKIQFMNSSPALRLSWASFPAKQSY